MSRVRISNAPDGWLDEGYSRPFVVHGYAGTLVEGESGTSQRKRRCEMPLSVGGVCGRYAEHFGSHRSRESMDRENERDRSAA